MLPDGIDDGGREVDVKVTQKHNAVVILRMRTHIYLGSSETPVTFRLSCPISVGFNTHVYKVDACLQASGALKVSTQLHILVSERYAGVLTG